jgi:hypothetical protein
VPCGSIATAAEPPPTQKPVMVLLSRRYIHGSTLKQRHGFPGSVNFKSSSTVECGNSRLDDVCISVHLDTSLCLRNACLLAWGKIQSLGYQMVCERRIHRFELYLLYLLFSCHVAGADIRLHYSSDAPAVKKCVGLYKVACTGVRSGRDWLDNMHKNKRNRICASMIVQPIRLRHAGLHKSAPNWSEDGLSSA